MAFVNPAAVPAVLSSRSSSPRFCVRAPPSFSRPAMTLARPPPTSAPSPSPSRASDAPLVEPISPISGSAEFLAACAASAEDSLVVVQFKAPWCRSCKALEPKVRRLAREYLGTVRFFSMNYEDPENKLIAFRADVKSMPTFMFFYGAAGKVEQFTCGPNRAGMLREKIEQYVAGECTLKEHRMEGGVAPKQ